MSSTFYTKLSETDGLNKQLPDNEIQKIAAIIHNYPLASSIYKSVASAINSSTVELESDNSVWDVFKQSLDAAIRDIDKHPRGKLFRRLIEYGPHNPDVSLQLSSDDEGTLSDPECGECVQFIFSHMVNRFKGELAELLSLEPCLQLIDQLQAEGLLPKSIKLYCGDLVQEKRRTRITGGVSKPKWGGFTKGADGLIVEKISSKKMNENIHIKIHGVIEVKSMILSQRKILAQIKKHILRLQGGVKLCGKVWPNNQIKISEGLLIMVVPSVWKLSREWQSVKTEPGRKIVFPEPSEPKIQTHIEKLKSNHWKIKLAWSQESLNQAAYEMTFWYMSQVGKHVYANKPLPKDWIHMTPEEAGYNAIKMMLYYVQLRNMTEKQELLATKLYNVYSFGYPLGVDSKEMLWPEDFPL